MRKSQLLVFAFALFSAAAFGKSPPTKSKRTNSFVGHKRFNARMKDYPYRAIGALKTADGFQCTATLVSPNLILTAAHCVVDETSGKFVKAPYIFYPAMTEDTSLDSSEATVVDIGMCADGSLKKESCNFDLSAKDWAILLLKKPLGNDYGWLAVDGADIQSKIGNEIYTLVGYSADMGNQGRSASQIDNCGFTRARSGNEGVFHNCDMDHGASGGAIFAMGVDAKGNLLPSIVAINVAEIVPTKGADTLRDVHYSDKGLANANVACPASSFYSNLIAAADKYSAELLEKKEKKEPLVQNDGPIAQKAPEEPSGPVKPDDEAVDSESKPQETLVGALDRQYPDWKKNKGYSWYAAAERCNKGEEASCFEVAQKLLFIPKEDPAMVDPDPVALKEENWPAGVRLYREICEKRSDYPLACLRAYSWLDRLVNPGEETETQRTGSLTEAQKHWAGTEDFKNEYCRLLARACELGDAFSYCNYDKGFYNWGFYSCASRLKAVASKKTR